MSRATRPLNAIIFALSAFLVMGSWAGRTSPAQDPAHRDSARRTLAHSSSEWRDSGEGAVPSVQSVDDVDDDDERWKGLMLASTPASGGIRDDWGSPSSELLSIGSHSSRGNVSPRLRC